MRAGPLVIALLVVTAASARADVASHRRVVLVAMPDRVFSAAAAALGPWSIAVDATAGPLPADDDAAATIARDHGATAVAWLDGGDLVIYDALRGVSDRRPAPPPTDDVAAAAIALSLKTTLRKPVVIVKLPTVAEVPPPPPWIETPVEPVPPPAPAARRVRVAAHLGVDVPAGAPVEPTVRGDARVELDVTPGGPSVVVAAGLGGVRGVDTPALAARYVDGVVAGGVAWRRGLGADLAVTPSVLATMHVSRLHGTTTDDREVGSTTTTAGVELAAGIDRKIGGLRAGVLVTGEARLRPTRYQLEGVDILRIPRFGVGVSLRIAF